MNAIVDGVGIAPRARRVIIPCCVSEIVSAERSENRRLFHEYEREMMGSARSAIWFSREPNPLHALPAKLEWEKYRLAKLTAEEQLVHLREIQRRLTSLGIAMQKSGEVVEGLDSLVDSHYGEGWQVVDQILQILPDSLVNNGDLRGINFYARPVGAADGSAYRNHIVHMYRETMSGSRYGLAALFLHEIGHSTGAAMDPTVKERLQAIHQSIRDSYLEMPIFNCSRLRKLGFYYDFSEFSAENVVVYISLGDLLREKATQSQDWLDFYQYYRDHVFNSIEYYAAG